MTKKIKTIVTALVVIAGLSSLVFLPKSKLRPKANAEYALASVMITNLKENSGGSGVVLESDQGESKILTNAHVCEVVKNGGIVQSDLARGVVTSFKQSQVHDLCLITTNTDFKVGTSVSDSSPVMYEEATVIGHPLLLPNLITRGNFSHKRLITLMTGIRKCTEEEQNSDLNLLCFFLGGIPIIKTLEAQVIAATIQPGSSGSPVFNASGEISGLVFAGQGQLSYGLIVPGEYLRYFVNNEVHQLKAQVPSNTVNLIEEDPRSKLRTLCAENEKLAKTEHCTTVTTDLIF